MLIKSMKFIMRIISFSIRFWFKCPIIDFQVKKIVKLWGFWGFFLVFFLCVLSSYSFNGLEKIIRIVCFIEIFFIKSGSDTEF